MCTRILFLGSKGRKKKLRNIVWSVPKFSNSSQISKWGDGWPAVPHALPSREQSLWDSVMKLCSVFCSEGGRRALHAESSSPEQLGQRGWLSCNFVAVSFRCQVFWACPLGFDRTTYIWVKQSSHSYPCVTRWRIQSGLEILAEFRMVEIWILFTLGHTLLPVSKEKNLNKVWT